MFSSESPVYGVPSVGQMGQICEDEAKYTESDGRDLLQLTLCAVVCLLVPIPTEERATENEQQVHSWTDD